MYENRDLVHDCGWGGDVDGGRKSACEDQPLWNSIFVLCISIASMDGDGAWHHMGVNSIGWCGSFHMGCCASHDGGVQALRP